MPSRRRLGLAASQLDLAASPLMVLSVGFRSPRELGPSVRGISQSEGTGAFGSWDFAVRGNWGLRLVGFRSPRELGKF